MPSTNAPAPDSHAGAPTWQRTTPRRRAVEGEPRRWRRYGFLLLAALLVLNALAGERGYLEFRRLERRYADAAAQLAARRAENEALQRRIRQLKSDPEAIAVEIRGQLGYVKPGEVVFTVRDAPPKISAAPPLPR